ncbi:hypothetical protein KFE94_02935 [bacterium SCSIO 12643]|nr:hypothetical protein KFE94_02935 [bacterium SCSIO 12643]
MISRVITSPKQKADQNTNPTAQRKSLPKIGFKNNRVESVAQRKLHQSIHNSSPVTQLKNQVIQLQSKINYGPLNDMKAGDYNIKVGSKVDAHLDPAKPLTGSDTSGFSGWGKNFYTDMKALTNDSWVAGHLINHDLGGRGVLHNFFPITKKANSLHLHEVEYPVKGWISDGHTVDYSVSAWKKDGADNPNPSGYFDCTAEVTAPASGKSKPGKIHKQIQSLTTKFDDKRAKYAYFDDNKITERKRRGVPLAWLHERGGKTDRDYEKEFGTGSWWNSNDTTKSSFFGGEFGSDEDSSDEHED